MLIGIVGKPSAGKSTFLNAACLTKAKTGNYPFTTIEPNLGTSYIRTQCVCKEFNVKDNPKNSICINGIRYIPIKLLDVAGLVPGAHMGKGLGNQFLSDLSRADVLLHILDLSGELDEEGRELEDNSHDPIKDIEFLEREIDLWFKDIIMRKDWSKFVNKIKMEKSNLIDLFYERLTGVGVKKEDIIFTLEKTKLNNKEPQNWKDIDIENFAINLRKKSKPILIIGNKIDKKHSIENFERLKDKKGLNIIPCSALAELVLRSFAEKNIIEYFPGDSDFKILDQNKLNEKEFNTLKEIKEKILDVYGSTGVQTSLNKAVFEILEQIVVYPVQNEKNLSDKDGNVLPDAFIVPKDMELKEFVQKKIHSDLAKNFIYGINVRTKRRLGEKYKLKDKDVIKIVSAARKS